MLRQYQQEIDKLRQLLENRQSTPLKVEDVDVNDNHQTIEINKNVIDRSLDAKRDQLIQEYQTEMEKLKNLHENERAEKESILKQIDVIKEEYKNNLDKLNNEIKPNEEPKTLKEDILKRISELKASMIGGERVNDKELSERRKKKKLASERRLRYVRRIFNKKFKSVFVSLHLAQLLTSWPRLT